MDDRVEAIKQKVQDAKVEWEANEVERKKKEEEEKERKEKEEKERKEREENETKDKEESEEEGEEKDVSQDDTEKEIVENEEKDENKETESAKDDTNQESTKPDKEKENDTNDEEEEDTQDNKDEKPEDVDTKEDVDEKEKDTKDEEEKDNKDEKTQDADTKEDAEDKTVEDAPQDEQNPSESTLVDDEKTSDEKETTQQEANDDKDGSTKSEEKNDEKKVKSQTPSVIKDRKPVKKDWELTDEELRDKRYIQGLALMEGRSDIARGFQYLIEAADLGHVSAQLNVAQILTSDEASYYGQTKDQKRGLTYFQRAAFVHESPTAVFTLAMFYQKGYIFKPDFLKCYYMYSFAALQGNSVAIFNIAVSMYERAQVREGLLVQLVNDAIEWWKLAMNRGYPTAAYNIGITSKTLATATKDQKRLESAAKYFHLANQWDSNLKIPANLSPPKPQPQSKPPTNDMNDEEGLFDEAFSELGLDGEENTKSQTPNQTTSKPQEKPRQKAFPPRTREPDTPRTFNPQDLLSRFDAAPKPGMELSKYQQRPKKYQKDPSHPEGDEGDEGEVQQEPGTLFSILEYTATAAIIGLGLFGVSKFFGSNRSSGKGGFNPSVDLFE